MKWFVSSPRVASMALLLLSFSSSSSSFFVDRVEAATPATTPESSESSESWWSWGVNSLSSLGSSLWSSSSPPVSSLAHPTCSACLETNKEIDITSEDCINEKEEDVHKCLMTYAEILGSSCATECPLKEHTKRSLNDYKWLMISRFDNAFKYGVDQDCLGIMAFYLAGLTDYATATKDAKLFEDLSKWQSYPQIKSKEFQKIDEIEKRLSELTEWQTEVRSQLSIEITKLTKSGVVSTAMRQRILFWEGRLRRDVDCTTCLTSNTITPPPHCDDLSSRSEHCLLYYAKRWSTCPSVCHQPAKVTSWIIDRVSFLGRKLSDLISNARNQDDLLAEDVNKYKHEMRWFNETLKWPDVKASVERMEELRHHKWFVLEHDELDNIITLDQWKCTEQSELQVRIEDFQEGINEGAITGDTTVIYLDIKSWLQAIQQKCGASSSSSSEVDSPTMSPVATDTGRCEECLKGNHAPLLPPTCFSIDQIESFACLEHYAFRKRHCSTACPLPADFDVKASGFLKAQGKKILETIQQAKSLETLKDPILLQSMERLQMVGEMLQMSWVREAIILLKHLFKKQMAKFGDELTPRII